MPRPNVTIYPTAEDHQQIRAWYRLYVLNRIETGADYLSMSQWMIWRILREETEE